MRWNLAIDYDLQAAEEFLTIHQTRTNGSGCGVEGS
jgi:hypothetical protein